MERPTHYIKIYPSGKTDTKDVKLQFNTKVEKDSYVKSEFLFCKKECDKYSISLGEIRQDYKEEYLLKRVQFAKQMKFAPKSRSEKFIWVREKSTLSVA